MCEKLLKNGKKMMKMSVNLKETLLGYLKGIEGKQKQAITLDFSDKTLSPEITFSFLSKLS